MDERKAFELLKEGKTRVSLTTGKRVSVVVMNKKDCVQKAEKLLGQHQTYKTIPADPTIRQKKRLINLLKNINAEGGIKDTT